MHLETQRVRPLAWLTIATIAVVLLSTASMAAVNVKREPRASFSGATVTVSGGNFSGLGNDPAFANLTVTGYATYICRNPQGHPSPGQNPVPAEPGSSGPVNLGNSEHNGRGTITTIVASITAPSPSAQEVGCGGQGSTQWTVELDELVATNAQLIVSQNGTQLFCWNYVAGGDPTGTPC